MIGTFFNFGVPIQFYNGTEKTENWRPVRPLVRFVLFFASIPKKKVAALGDYNGVVRKLFFFLCAVRENIWLWCLWCRGRYYKWLQKSGYLQIHLDAFFCMWLIWIWLYVFFQGVKIIIFFSLCNLERCWFWTFRLGKDWP